MAYRPQFKLLEGWIDDPATFPSEVEADAYALAVAMMKTTVIDFTVVQDSLPYNSWMVPAVCYPRKDGP